MSSRVIVSVLCLFVLGCPQESKTNARSSAGAFDSNLVVRLDSPTNGATVQSPFVVEYTVGPGVDSFELMVSDVSVEDAAVDADGQGSTEFEVDNGRHRITLEGWDSDGILLNEHRIDVNVVDMEGPWVTITTPTTGAVVSNPVLFGVEASEHIDSVEFLADEWPLGVVSPGELLTYEFDGTGYERSIEAFGYSDGELLATDNIQITVSEDQVVAASDWNAVMMELIDTYPTDGSVTYDWTDAGHGTTMDIYYNGEVVASAGPGSTSFCCGITFEVYMRAFTQIDEELGGDGLLNGMSVDDVLEFRRDWFVRDLWGDGPGVGLDNYGLGEPIVDWADILPGDPVQLWRFSGSGHSVIFMDWVTDTDGTIVGLDYWSTQPSTDGIGYGREYFGTGGSDMDPAYFYAARAWMPYDWLPW
ncbi:MAG: hypothetical protein CL930_07255 [Deltaproteobacteria bacterium]|nr:hypothetical protein [Deltaproteobacteria bacterium]